MQISKSSYIQSFLSNEEGILMLPDQINFTNGNDRNLFYRRIGSLFLNVLSESVEGLLKGRLKRFDALIKNFGCQITALEVSQLSMDEELYQEAVDLQAKFKQILNGYQLNLTSTEVKATPATMPFSTYCKDVAKLDIEVSAKMTRLARLRFLCLVNSNKKCVVDGQEREKPSTNVDNFYQKKMIKLNDSPKRNYLKKLVEIIQIDESKRAATFIGDQSNLINSQDVSVSIIKRSLSKDFRGISAKGIVSLSLTYSTLCIIKRVATVLLVKNKRKIVDTITDERSLKAYYIKQNDVIRPLSKDEISHLKLADRLVVFEGYVPRSLSLQEDTFADRITAIGLERIVEANCVVLPQYAAKASCERFVQDEEIQLDLLSHQDNEIMKNLFELEHVFASTVQEEMDNEFTT